MRIRLHDDGKEKEESFHAYIEPDFFLLAWGNTKDEVVSTLKNLVNEAIEKLKNIDFDQIDYVNVFGDKIIKLDK